MTGKQHPSQDSDKYVLRFTEHGIRAQLKSRAALNNRTLNGEINYLIKRGLEAEQAKETQQ